MISPFIAAICLNFQTAVGRLRMNCRFHGRPDHPAHLLCGSPFYVASLFLLTVFSFGFASVSAQELEFNQNEFTQQFYAAKTWLNFSAEIGSSDFNTEDQPEISEQWKACDTAANVVAKAWNSAFETDALIPKAIECTNRFGEREAQAQHLRRTLLKHYGRDKFDQMQTAGAAYQAAIAHSWIDLNDTDLVRLYLWAGKLASDIAADDQRPAEAAPATRQTYQWLSQDEPFSSIIQERGPPQDEGEAIEVFRLGAEKANAAMNRQVDDFLAKNTFPPGMLTYLRIRHEANILEFCGRNYLRSELPKHEEISLAEKQFTNVFGGLNKRLPSLIDSLHLFMKKDFDRASARMVEIYNEYKVEDPRPPCANCDR